MSTSFYGSLPEEELQASDNATSVPITIAPSTQVTRSFVEYTTTTTSDISPEKLEGFSTTTTKFTKFLDDADLDFEKTFQQQSKVVSSVVTQNIQSSSTSLSSVTETSSKSSSSSTQSTTQLVEKSTEEKSAEKTSEKKDENLWDKPLGKKIEKENMRIVFDINVNLIEFFCSIGLPSPAPALPDSSVNTTPKRERKLLATKNKINLPKRSQSPMAGKKLSPVYMDLAYVPHHGNSYYSHVEFFKKIRARYYVFSGTEPSKDVYMALLEAKQTWEDKNLGMNMSMIYLYIFYS